LLDEWHALSAERVVGIRRAREWVGCHASERIRRRLVEWIGRRRFSWPARRRKRIGRWLVGAHWPLDMATTWAGCRDRGERVSGLPIVAKGVDRPAAACPSAAHEARFHFRREKV
jgi:hypothetical protein